MIDRTVVGKQLGLAIARMVRMRETEVDEERLRVLGGLAVVQVVQDLLGVPRAARFICVAAFDPLVSRPPAATA